MLKIHLIVNNPVSSNCFVVYDKEYSNECLIIDPGSEDSSELLKFLQENELSPLYILLTHEHFDHSWGCNVLQKTYSVPILSSQLCGERVRHHKTNYSAFFNPLSYFDVDGEICAITFDHPYHWLGQDIYIYNTPGHTDSSITVRIENSLFTGDTLIKGLKTVTKLPGGSKEKTKQSMELIQSLIGQGLIVYPGHGTEFYLDSYDF